MLLYRKKLFNCSCDIFRYFCDNDAIKDTDDVGILALFSANLETSIFTKVGNAEVMPVELSSVDFALHRIDAFKLTCQQKNIEDKRNKELLNDFGITLQRNLFD